MTFNQVDWILLAIFFISILGGMFRGGVREIFSLGTWIAAFVVSGLFAKPLAALFASSGGEQSAGQVSTLATSTSFCVLFIGILLIGAFLGRMANTLAEGAGVSIFNRFLGALFGFARGYLINVILIFLVGMSSFAESAYWKESSLVPRLQPAVDWLGSKIEPGVTSLKSQMGETIDKMTSSPDKTATDQKAKP